MAVNLNNPLTYYSFPITKFDRTDDGDLVVYGKATDGSIDSDKQIVDPTWSAKALEKWLDTGGNVRVQHNPQLYPAGRGLSVEVDRDGDNAHWVKALVVEPTAKTLVEKRVLRAFSVGISNPVIRRDVTGKAAGGIVTGGDRTEIAELSLVDRPANSNCGITLVKSADTVNKGDGGWTYGDLQALVEAAAIVDAAEARGLVLKSDDAPGDHEDGDHEAPPTKPADEPGGEQDSQAETRQDYQVEAADDDAPKNEDDEDRGAYKAAVAQHRAAEPRLPDVKMGGGTELLVKQAVRQRWQAWDTAGTDAGLDGTEAGYQRWLAKRDFDPGVGGGVDRDKLGGGDFVDPERRRFPIVTPGDVQDAVSLQGRANPPVPGFREKLTALARRKGPAFVAALPDSWSEGSAEKNITLTAPLASGLVPYNLAGQDDDGKRDMVEPDLTKAALCPRCGADVDSAKRCPECGKKLKKMYKAALTPDVVKRPSYPGQKWKHGWIWLGAGPNPRGGDGAKHTPAQHRAAAGHLAEHHRAMASGQWEQAVGHLRQAGDRVGQRSVAMHPDFQGGTNYELADKLEQMAQEISRSAPAPKGRMGPKQKAFHAKLAEAYDALHEGRTDDAHAIMMTATMSSMNPDAPRARGGPRVPKAPVEPKAPKPKKQRQPFIEEFDERPRSAWMEESRRAQQEGMARPKPGAPAHELARAVGQHRLERAIRDREVMRRAAEETPMFGVPGRAVRTDEQYRAEVEQEVARSLAVFRAKHDERVRMAGLTDARGLTRESHSEMLDRMSRHNDESSMFQGMSWDDRNSYQQDLAAEEIAADNARRARGEHTEHDVSHGRSHLVSLENNARRAERLREQIAAADAKRAKRGKNAPKTRAQQQLESELAGVERAQAHYQGRFDALPEASRAEATRRRERAKERTRQLAQEADQEGRARAQAVPERPMATGPSGGPPVQAPPTVTSSADASPAMGRFREMKERIARGEPLDVGQLARLQRVLSQDAADDRQRANFSGREPDAALQQAAKEASQLQITGAPRRSFDERMQDTVQTDTGSQISREQAGRIMLGDTEYERRTGASPTGRAGQRSSLADGAGGTFTRHAHDAVQGARRQEQQGADPKTIAEGLRRAARSLSGAKITNDDAVSRVDYDADSLRSQKKSDVAALRELAARYDRDAAELQRARDKGAEATRTAAEQRAADMRGMTLQQWRDAREAGSNPAYARAAAKLEELQQEQEELARVRQGLPMSNRQRNLEMLIPHWQQQVEQIRSGGGGGLVPERARPPANPTKRARAKARAAELGIRRVKNARGGEEFMGKTAKAKPGYRHREPDGPAVEALEHDAGWPTTPDTTTTKAAGTVPYGVQRMHDALCPAFSWDAVAAEYPTLKSIGEAIDPAWFLLRVLDPGRQGDTNGILYASTMVDQADALTKGNLDPAMIADARADLHKAFNQANIGGHQITPGQFRRPFIAAGHATPNAAAGRPTLMPPPVHVIDADDFHRGLITEGHQAESPGDAGNNLDTGGSTKSGSARIWYPNASRTAAAASMRALHDHIAAYAESPGLCPMAPSRPVMPADMQASARPVPVGEPVIASVTKSQTTLPPVILPVQAVVDTPDGGLTRKQIKTIIRKSVAAATANYEQQIAALQAEIEELASQPDPAQAPVRGAVMVNKATTLDNDETPAPVERISLVEKALRDAARTREDEIAYANHVIATSPDPSLRLTAEQFLRDRLGDLAATP